MTILTSTAAATTIAPNYKKYPYTICFIFNESNDKVLLLNREKAPWKGCWNGIGGKLEAEKDNTVLDGITREIQEEAGISDPTSELLEIESRGVMEWYMLYTKLKQTDPDGKVKTVLEQRLAENIPEEEVKGMYIFTARISDHKIERYLSENKLPISFNEGILAWKKVSWALDEGNLGVVKNIKLAFPFLQEANERSVFKTYFVGDHNVLHVDFLPDGTVVKQ